MALVPSAQGLALPIVRQNANLNYSYLISGLSRKQTQTQVRDYSSANLQIQDEIEAKFKVLEDLLAKYTIQEVQSEVYTYPLENGEINQGRTTTKIVVSDVTAKQIENAQKDAEKSIQKIMKLFQDQTLNLSEHQIRILNSGIHGLMSVANQTSSLIQIANSVSFKRKNDDSAAGMADKTQQCFNNAATSTKTDRTGRMFQLESAKCKEMARQADSK